MFLFPHFERYLELQSKLLFTTAVHLEILDALLFSVYKRIRIWPHHLQGLDHALTSFHQF